MSWRDRYRGEAQYRGAKFRVESSDYSSSARIGVHEIINRDAAPIEHLGRRPRRWRLDAYVLGEDYDQERDELIRALERPPLGGVSSGVLRHPYLGILSATCVRFSMREERRRGRLATFSIEFVEDLENDRQAEMARARSAAQVGAIATQVSEAAAVEALEEIEVEGVAEYAREALASLTTTLGKQLQTLRIFETGAQRVAQLGQRITSMIERASTLVTAPAELVGVVRDTLGDIAATATNARGALVAYEHLFGFDSNPSGGSSATSLAADKNTAALATQVRRSALAGAAQAAQSVSWEYREEAIEARERLLAELDLLIGTAPDDAIDTLEELRTSLVAALPPAEQDLPRLRTLELEGTTPALVLSYRLYGLPDFADSIAQRNRLPRPGFVPGGVPLEVLTRA